MNNLEEKAVVARELILLTDQARIKTRVGFVLTATEFKAIRDMTEEWRRLERLSRHSEIESEKRNDG